ncbi:serpin family protein [Amycolatopsis rhabdoformis]|uniref:Serpin family protein n=1 Tax=Amycolatopsis rhabdoformis TaxID=1448059 RepID=A0ABZ1IKS9_9PSEU|nr:serpin family protein [Amycolatopsis rhabdoformis]WSE34794.1 serpin family protein [Amycolatopsis rhabdoformis]
MAVDSHLDFMLALGRVAAAGGGDACFSPYSAASALGLAARAARGQTADELRKLLTSASTSDTDTDNSAASTPNEAALEAHATVLREAANLGDEAQLAVANTLWASDEITVEGSFLEELVAWPGGKAETAPFATDPEAARGLINGDVDRTTNGLIPELLPGGAVTVDTRASLVNALYLKTGWRHPFPAGATASAEFHSPGETRRVPTMRLEETLGYHRADGWQVVSLPAQGGVEAVVLLPDGDLAPAEAALDTARLKRLLDGTSRRKVRLALPKIELDLRTDLDGALRALGVRELFTAEADLTGLTATRPLWVDSVVHQAVLRLDEQGLEGAAATAIQIRTMSLSTAEPLDVAVDRPFLLLVRHAGTGAVYFFARVVRP